MSISGRSVTILSLDALSCRLLVYWTWRYIFKQVCGRRFRSGSDFFPYNPLSTKPLISAEHNTSPRSCSVIKLRPITYVNYLFVSLSSSSLSGTAWTRLWKVSDLFIYSPSIGFWYRFSIQLHWFLEGSEVRSWQNGESVIGESEEPDWEIVFCRAGGRKKSIPFVCFREFLISSSFQEWKRWTEP